MKFIVLVLMVFCATACFSACSEKNRDSNVNAENVISNTEEKFSQATKTVKDFFSAFEKSDYEAMREYCSKECTDAFFHDGDVFGMAWAKLERVGEYKENYVTESGFAILLDVKMETVESSSLYPEAETTFYIVLKEKSDGVFVIDTFITG